MYNTENDPRFDVHRVSGEDLLEIGLDEDHKDNAIVPHIDYFIVTRISTSCVNVVPVEEYDEHVILRFWVETQYYDGLLDFSKQSLEKDEYHSIHEILEKTSSVLDLFVEKEWWDVAATFRDQIKETKSHYNINY